MASIMDGLKQAASTLRAADKIPEYNAILDAQQRIFDLQNENQELKDKVSQLSRKQTLDFEDGHNWLVDSGSDNERHFCPRCWDKDGVRSPLYDGNYCVTCKGTYE